MRFLVVDDSRAMQSIIKRSLNSIVKEECEIKTASDGAQAFNLMREWKPDMILTDWHMPVMNGMELMEKIQHEMLDIKIGFITTETSEKRIEEAKKAGALFVIQKPFEQEDLVETVLPLLQNTPQKQNNTANNNNDDYNSDNQSTPKLYVLPNSNRFSEIANSLSRQEILVEQIDPIGIENKQLPCLVGLIDDGKSTTIRAVCILELRAACVLGSSISDISSTHARNAISQRQIKGPILEGCKKLLAELSSKIHNSETMEPLQLRSVNVIAKTFPKLESMYKHSENRRADFEIAVLDKGEGLMTIITV